MSDNKDLAINKQFITELLNDACFIIDQAQEIAYRQVNEVLIKRNWLLGMRIQYEVLKAQRAEYGKQIVFSLADDLTKRYGKSFTWRNLYNYIDFYKKHDEFFMLDKEASVSPDEILHSLRAKSSDNNASNILNRNSRWDRYLGMTAAMTLVPVPTATVKKVERRLASEEKKAIENKKK